MRKQLILIPAVAILATIGIAGPASAATDGDTPITFEVTGGALSITVPGGPVSLGTVATSAGSQVVSANLGIVTVTDDRGGTDGWIVTAVADDFTGPQSISVSEPGLSSYTTPGASIVGVANVGATSLDALYPPAAVQVATGVDGINSATWNPTISLTIPADALAGNYSSSVTHSVG
jgi:hypothetical protein